LQGNSGVAVAKEPPAAAGDPDAFALWVAFAAGLMALVSTTPLGALRSGVGGRLDAGRTGGGRGVPAPKAPKSNPPKKEKEKEPKKPKARFDDEIAVVSAPPKATKARFDEDIAVVSAPPKATKARFDEEPPPPKPIPAPKLRFDEERVPPRVSPTVAKPRFDEEPFPALVVAAARFDEERDSDPRVPICTPEPRYSFVAGPTPTPSPTPFPSLTTEQLVKGACAVSDAVDPFQTNPAFAGGPGGLKDIIDGMVQTVETTPPTGFWAFELARFVVGVFDGTRKTASTAVSIVCQQVQHEGIYYDVFPIDEKIDEVEDSWSNMTTLQKATTIAIGIGIIATALAIPK